MLAVCGSARKAKDARAASRAASYGSHRRVVRRARLGCNASRRGSSSLREVATVSSACGWFSMMRMSSRAAYPEAPTSATPIFVVTLCLRRCCTASAVLRQVSKPVRSTAKSQPAHAMSEITNPIATSCCFIFQT